MLYLKKQSSVSSEQIPEKNKRRKKSKATEEEKASMDEHSDVSEVSGDFKQVITSKKKP